MANNENQRNRQLFNEDVVTYLHEQRKVLTSQAPKSKKKSTHATELEKLMKTKGKAKVLSAYFDNNEIDQSYIDKDVARKQTQEAQDEFMHHFNGEVHILAAILQEDYYTEKDINDIAERIKSVVEPKISAIKMQEKFTYEGEYEPDTGSVTISNDEDLIDVNVYSSIVKALGSNYGKKDYEEFNEDVLHYLMNRRNKYINDKLVGDWHHFSGRHSLGRLDKVIQSGDAAMVLDAYIDSDVQQQEKLAGIYSMNRMSQELCDTVEEQGITLAETNGVKRILGRIKQKFIEMKAAVKGKVAREDKE